MTKTTPPLLSLTLLGLLGCSGTSGKPITTTGPIDPQVDAGFAAQVDAHADPAVRLVALVDEIVAKVDAAEDCDALANTLGAWTHRNRQTVEALITEIGEQPGNGDDASRLDERVVNGYLVVVEAAADCGSNEAAMSAYDSFAKAVEKATY